NMMLIVLVCLLIGSATSCSLVPSLNSSITLDELAETWLTQYTMPEIPEKCWKDEFQKIDTGYQIRSTATDPE
ncbi:hypothetical protein L9F63_003279, partial [Diploptera punctata]